MRNGLLLATIVLAALLGAACNSAVEPAGGELGPTGGSDQQVLPGSGYGAVTVQLSTASPTVQAATAPAANGGSLLVGFNSLTLYNHLDPMQVVEVPVDPEQPVDLMAAAADPVTLLEGVPVPEGEYDCISWEIASVEACGMPAPMPANASGDVCTAAPFLVSDGEQVTLLIEMPELSFDCASMHFSMGSAMLSVR
ncbi:MAG: hypothetical protein D6718_13880 [Acidobacteria bacterium]|nr:MAG: hypothetical protein D6718_13880 [Acidobacteriota bacterium]